MKDFNVLPSDDEYCVQVQIHVYIRCEATSEVRIEDTYALMCPDEETPSLFIWREGNYSCDCNRELFFRRLGGEEEGDPDCGDERYSVCIVNPFNNEVLYREFDLDPVVG